MDRQLCEYIIIIFLAVVYNGFLIGAVLHSLETKEMINWCSGVGFLILMTSFIYFGLFYKFVMKKIAPSWLKFKISDGFEKFCQMFSKKWMIGLCLTLFLIGIVTFVSVDSSGDLNRMISLLGMFLIILISISICETPKKIRWRGLFFGLGLNFCLVLSKNRWSGFQDVSECLRIFTFKPFGNSTFLPRVNNVSKFGKTKFPNFWS